MSRAKAHKFTRKLHRYLGVFIGIQFLAWTLGGLYFAWTDLDTVHGSDRLNPSPPINSVEKLQLSDPLLQSIKESGYDTIHRIELVSATESLQFIRLDASSSQEDGPERSSLLVDLDTGNLRPGLSQEESIEVAKFKYKGEAEVDEVRVIESVGKHHEYREMPLPVFAVEFADDRRTTLYVAPDYGRVVSARNGKWRIFDFLWMLHTMDYEGRDNFNNNLLKAFSILGLLTIMSGFALFFFSSPLFRAKRHIIPD